MTQPHFIIQERLAHERVNDRVRAADNRRRVREVLRRAEENHRREVDRVRESVLLLPRIPRGGSRES